MSAQPQAPTANPDEYRLPANVKPTHYDVTVRTDLEKLEFDGVVKVHLDVLQSTSTITFNVEDLELGNASLYSEALNKDQVEISRSLDTKQKRGAVTFSEAVPAGSKAQLLIAFKGKLTGNMAGYYKSEYQHDGQTKNYTLTQFEATSARRAFPCWDEPALKATYAITMISRADTVNLSNMPVASEGVYEPKDNSTLEEMFAALSTEPPVGKWKITKFETTPKMSSYLAAYANGPFEHLESSYVSPLSGKNRTLRIYATPDLIGQAQYALDVKAKVIPLYEKVFDVEYALPKLDSLVAHDFDAGAMENWGLITGRTSALCLDPKRADLAGMKRVAEVQTHEVAHQWFGNYTTMEWWDELYLNEGFATLMGEVIILDKIYPEWKLDSEFVNTHLTSALSLDSKLSSHPIHVDCADASKIDQIFDALSYSKAASVLRMLSNYVGEDKFLKGVSIYLKNNAYGNSTSKSLWGGISEAAQGIDVIALMENWITKIGFPVLTVTETADGIHVRQDRFLQTGVAEPKDNETVWTVPLSLLSVGSDGKAALDKTLVLKEREGTFKVDTSKSYKLNANTTGVYRVAYPPERLSKIAQEAAKENSVFSLTDRQGLVKDAMALSEAGIITTSSALDLVYQFRDEKEYLVLAGIGTSLAGFAATWWEDETVLNGLKALRRALFAPVVQRLGYEFKSDDHPDVTQLRTLAITECANSDEPSVVDELKKRFAQYTETGDDSKIPADLVTVTYAMAVKHGGRKEYEAVKSVLDKADAPPTAKMAAMRALGRTQDDECVKDLLEYIKTGSRDQDIIYYILGLKANKDRSRATTKWFYENYDYLFKRFETNTMFKYIVNYGLSGFSSRKDYDEIKDFFKDKETASYSLILAQTLDGIDARSKFVDRSTADITQWLQKAKL